MRFGEGAEEPISHCPYCGFEGSECWWTREQAEYLSAVTAVEILGPDLKRMAGRISSQGEFLGVQANMTLPDIPAEPQEVDDSAFEIITFPCCQETIRHDGESNQLNCIICGESVEVRMERADKIFLSHKGCDKPKVREFKKTLELLGFRPWLDEDAMTAGVELERAISQGFKDSCAVVFFVTPSFKDEKYLATEVNYAIREKRSKGDHFQIITLCLQDDSGEQGQVPELVQVYVWKKPQSDLEALREILRALPIALGPTKWKEGQEASALDDTVASNSKRNKQLGSEATDLLCEAAAHDGTILAVPTSAGLHIQVGTRSFVEEGNPRSEATWLAALKELVQRAFIEDRGHKGDVFAVTKKGYEYADSAAAQDEVVNAILDLDAAEIDYLMLLSRPRNQEGIPSDSFDEYSGRNGEIYYAMVERFDELNLMRYAGGLYKITKKGYEVTDRLWQNLLLSSIKEITQEGDGAATLKAISQRARLTDGELESKECERLLKTLKQKECIDRREEADSVKFTLLPRSALIQRHLQKVSYDNLD